MSKILYAASTYSHIKNFHLDYIKALRNEGHEVLVMAKGEDADFNINFEKKILSLKNFSCQRKIKKILKAEKFDVLILNTTLAAFNIRAVLSKKKRPKVINIVHGYMFKKDNKGLKNKIFFAVEKILASRTDDIIVMNQEDLDITENSKLCAGGVYMTHGMGAYVPSPKVPREDIIKHMGCEGKYVITFIGEIYKRKNQRFLVCALPEIKIHIPNAVLWLIGEGESHGELSDLAEELSISDSVFFAGNRDNPCDFIRASDLYASASLQEGLPFNIVEALGCRKTVLASDVKGHRDLISDGVNGFLFDVSDMDSFVKKICDIHEGILVANEEKMYEQYIQHSKEVAFPETYRIIKELIEK